MILVRVESGEIRSIPHILPCIKLYSKMAAQVLVYGCVQF